ncbi:transmembrane protein 69 [Malaclemys terrapin pileata]|uniref:transmembrane protein 69 n=1 Tax=Malaclemys terrapin pileata TaxID=2991368 RepID=UPI0023A8AA8C|nr:transmembrane protein 69 [Malaclemys terrapin pileata]
MPFNPASPTLSAAGKLGARRAFPNARDLKRQAPEEQTVRGAGLAAGAELERLAQVLGWGSPPSAHGKPWSFCRMLRPFPSSAREAGCCCGWPCSLRFPWEGPSAKANMFHLVQRCCSNIPLKLQKLTLHRLLQYGRNKSICSSPASLPLQRVLSRPSGPQLLSQASACVTKAQEFHCSLPCLKKKKPQEPEPQQLGLLRHDMKSLKDSPKPAFYLGLAGLIPFVSVPVIMAIQHTYYPELAFAQMTYGATIVSFLGGIRWGFALPENSPANPDWMNLGNSIVPPLLAWFAILFKDNLSQAAIMVIIGLGIALHYDLAVLPTYPSWFKGLRVLLTVVAIISLVITLVLMDVYPEKQLSNSASKSK